MKDPIINPRRLDLANPNLPPPMLAINPQNKELTMMIQATIPLPLGQYLNNAPSEALIGLIDLCRKILASRDVKY